MIRSLFALCVLTLLTVSVAQAEHHYGNKGQWVDHMFKHLDADKDGKITQAEFLNSAEQRFQQKDTNKDGAWSKAEVQAYADAWKAKKQAHKAHPAEQPPAQE
jgi:hypothetical protein